MTNNSDDRKYKNKILASILTLSLLGSGTYAWNSFSQRATNETITSGGNAGARLHDYFDGVTKQVFVENYIDDENEAKDVFARIKLYEYLEYGNGAGLLEGDEEYDDKKVKIVRGNFSDINQTPDINKKDTWDTYYFDVAESDTSISAYYQIEMGGDSIYYMPTFMQNVMSLESDINGTLAGVDGERYEGIAYDDYQEYTEDSLKPGYITYLDPDTKLEIQETEIAYHKAKPTLSSSVISMEQWVEEGSELGDYWVYDIDGWAYWANPIAPNTATGMLISEIQNKQSFGEDQAYYGIHVKSQMATASDWGNVNDLSGMYEDITDDGIRLMRTIIGEYNPSMSNLMGLTGLTLTELKNMIGKDDTVEIDGMDYYVLDMDTVDTYTENGEFIGKEEAVLLWMTEPLNSITYTFTLLGNSAWGNSSLRNVLESVVENDETLEKMALRVDTTVVPYSGMTVESYDRLYALSYEEFLESYELEGTNRAISSDAVATYTWLRSPFMNTNVIMLHNTNGSVNNFVEAKYIGTVRPAFWAAL